MNSPKPAKCNHTTGDKWHPKSTVVQRYGYWECERCWASATIRSSLVPPPSHYLRRHAHIASNWEFCEWKSLEPRSWYHAEKWIQEWNNSSKNHGWEFALPFHCSACYTTKLSETYIHPVTGEQVCNVCYTEGQKKKKEAEEKNKMLCSHCGHYVKKFHNTTGPGLCFTCDFNKNQKIVAKAKANGVNPVTTPTNRKVGDIWKLPSANAPMGAEQWGYQGSAKAPYVITRYATKRDGSTTQDGWACGCMSFTRNVPRTPCKHILNVMLKEGVKPSTMKSSVKDIAEVAGLGDADVEAFKKWQREQAEKKEVKPTAGDADLELFGSTGRKFR